MTDGHLYFIFYWEQFSSCSKNFPFSIFNIIHDFFKGNNFWGDVKIRPKSCCLYQEIFEWVFGGFEYRKLWEFSVFDSKIYSRIPEISKICFKFVDFVITFPMFSLLLLIFIKTGPKLQVLSENSHFCSVFLNFLHFLSLSKLYFYFVYFAHKIIHEDFLENRLL